MARLSAWKKITSISIIFAMGLVTTAWAGDAALLSTKLLNIKTELVSIEQNLDQLAGEDRVVIYLDINKISSLALHSVVLSIDKKVVASIAMDPIQQASFDAGGIQKLYVGPLAKGKHELIATLSGTTDGPYTHTKRYIYDKPAGMQVVRLAIVDVLHQKQSEYLFKPEFRITPEL